MQMFSLRYVLMLSERDKLKRTGSVAAFGALSLRAYTAPDKGESLRGGKARPRCSGLLAFGIVCDESEKACWGNNEKLHMPRLTSTSFAGPKAMQERFRPRTEQVRKYEYMEIPASILTAASEVL